MFFAKKERGGGGGGGGVFKQPIIGVTYVSCLFVFLPPPPPLLALYTKCLFVSFCLFPACYSPHPTPPHPPLFIFLF